MGNYISLNSIPNRRLKVNSRNASARYSVGSQVIDVDPEGATEFKGDEAKELKSPFEIPKTNIPAYISVLPKISKGKGLLVVKVYRKTKQGDETVESFYYLLNPQNELKIESVIEGDFEKAEIMLHKGSEDAKLTLEGLVGKYKRPS
jgi:hypothetical protein